MKKYLIIIAIVAIGLIILSYIGDISDENEKKRLLEESKQAKMAKEGEAVNNDYRQLNPALFLSVEDAVADYNYMWQVFEDNYPFFGVASRLYNVRSQEIKEKYLREIQKKSGLGSFPTNAIWFGDIIQKCINEFKGLGNLWFISPSLYLDFKKSYEQTEKLNLLYEKIFLNEHSRQIYEAMGVDTTYYSTKVHAAKYDDGAVVYEFSGSPDETDPQSMILYGQNVEFDIFSRSEITGNIAYIKLMASPDHDNDAQFEYDRRQIMDFYSQIQDCDNLIIDMTKYYGDDTYWQKLIVEPNIAEDTGIEYYFTFKNGKENADLFDIININSWGSEIDTDLESLPNISHPDLQMFEKLYQSESTFNPAGGKKMFSGNIYVLYDNTKTYYPGAESFAYFCKNTGFAEIVGPQIKRGWPLVNGNNLVMLPNSGLIFNYSALYMMNKNGSSYDEYGTAPDYICNKNETPLDACARVIAGKKSANLR